MKYFAVVVALSAVTLFCSCKVSKPGSVENKVMTDIKQKVMIGGKDDQNPVPNTQENINEGKEPSDAIARFAMDWMVKTPGFRLLSRCPRQWPILKSKDVQDYADGQLHWIIVNGINPSGMPAWKGILEDDEMWKVVRYIRHLPEKGSLGTPEVFKEEEEQHKEMESGGTRHQPPSGGHEHHH